jgi:hypothetical protein
VWITSEMVMWKSFNLDAYKHRFHKNVDNYEDNYIQNPHRKIKVFRSCVKVNYNFYTRYPQVTHKMWIKLIVCGFIH